MPRFGFRDAFSVLIVLATAAWTSLAFRLYQSGTVWALALVAGLALTLLLGVWAMLNGKRLANGRLERASLCAACKSPVWPAEQALGFCLRCGSTKKPLPASS